MQARRLTIFDVAREAGVSPGAVSFALNGRKGVSALTRDRILDVARDLGWQPSHRARSLAAARAFAVGLVLARQPELIGADPFFPSFIAGVESVLAPSGYALVLQVVPPGPAEEASYRRLAAESRVDGVFLSDLRANDSRIALLQELQLPAVTLNAPDISSPFPAVCVDDGVGIAQAVRHLAELGHIRIGHVAGPVEFLHGRSRRAAWVTALRDAGLPRGPLISSDFTAAGGSRATRRLLRSPDPPTAIVYANDLMAIAGMAVAQQHDVRVPEDLSITGFDGAELSSYVHPPLTTIVTDPYGWGRSAAAILLDAISPAPAESGAVAQPGPVHLRVRSSTGPPPARPKRPVPRHRTDRAARAARVTSKEKL